MLSILQRLPEVNPENTIERSDRSASSIPSVHSSLRTVFKLAFPARIDLLCVRNFHTRSPSFKTDQHKVMNSDTLIPPSGEASPETDFPTVGTADIAVFWDFENVRIPNWCPATAASEGIRNKLSKYGRIVEKRLYYDSRQPAERSAPRSDLDLSGFTLVDCPSRGRKETLDKKLIVDVLCFAWERASMGAKACVVLITSDGDYSYALARLRDIGVFTIIIYRPDVVAKVLIDNAKSYIRGSMMFWVVHQYLKMTRTLMKMEMERITKSMRLTGQTNSASAKLSVQIQTEAVQKAAQH